MELNVDIRQNSRVAVVQSDGEIALGSAQDALDLMASARHLHDADRLVIPADAVCPEFWDLRTGLAGEALQKYTTYSFRVAFAGDFSQVESRALRDFIRESNRGSQVNFLPTVADCLDALHDPAQ